MTRSHATVLVVDRAGDVTRAIVSALRERGLHVLHAEDETAAYRILDEESVDAVVSELSAPRIDGMA
ncbi:MAG TPA: hypothetical protein VLV15_12180, partial [Dongiaceae bacterium]|nr:hypothetical protein [Dongiaceae bacterium]